MYVCRQTCVYPYVHAQMHEYILAGMQTPFIPTDSDRQTGSAKLRESKPRKFFETADSDGSGTLSYRELLPRTSECRTYSASHALRSSPYAFTECRSGGVVQHQLAAVFSKYRWHSLNDLVVTELTKHTEVVLCSIYVAASV